MRVVALLLIAGCGRIAFDGRPDATSTDAAPDASTQAACGLVGNLRDTFDGTSFDLDLWGQTYVPPATSIATTAGELVITPASNQIGTYVGLVSFRHYDLRGSRFIADVSSVPQNGEIAGIQLSNGASLVIISQQSGVITAAQRAPTYVQHVNTAYSPSAQRYWAISEQAGIVSWETSSDGVTFVPLAQMPAPFDLSRLRVELFIGTETTIASPGPLRVASIGSPSNAPYRACPPQFSETFDDPAVLQGRWMSSFNSTCCTLQITGGRFETTTDSTAGYAWLRSAEGYDLRGRTVGVELVQQGASLGLSQSLVLTRDYANKLALMRYPTGWDVFERVDGVEASNATMAMGEKFLRLVIDDTSYTAEVSVDGVGWRTLRTAPHPFALDDVSLELETGSTGGTSAPDMIVWDNFTAQ